MLSAKKLMYKVLGMFAKETYQGSNGLQISRVGKVATIDVFPTVTTTASSAVVGTITDEAFRPNADIDYFTQVYNGSSYVNCWLQIGNNGQIRILSASGSTTAGYQARYCKLKGLTYICGGGTA